MKNNEKRYFQATDLRAETDGESRKVSGYAAVFEQLSQPIFNFVEKIRAGAFADSIKNGDIRALWSHNSDLVLGRTTAKTLNLREDNHGLYFELSLPDTQTGRDAYTSIKRGDVTGMSFGFSVDGEEWLKGKDGQPHVRTLTKINLFEISPTAFPAYEQTSVQARDITEIVKEQEKKWAEEQKVEQEKQPNDALDKKKLALRILETELKGY